MVEISGTTDTFDGVLKALSNHTPDAYYMCGWDQPTS